MKENLTLKYYFSLFLFSFALFDYWHADMLYILLSHFGLNEGRDLLLLFTGHLSCFCTKVFYKRFSICCSHGYHHCRASVLQQCFF